MQIVNLLIEEKKLVNKIEERERERLDYENKIRNINKEVELSNIKALKLHKQQLESAGCLVIKEN